MILESEYYNMNIKEQALSILANVADGTSSKEFIMGNEDLLRKINSFMVSSRFVFTSKNKIFLVIETIVRIKDKQL